MLKQTLPSSEYYFWVLTYFRVLLTARVVILPKIGSIGWEREISGNAIFFSLSYVCHTMRYLGVILLQFSFWRLLCVRVNTITGKPQEGCACVCVCVCACGCILGLELQINSLFLSRDQEGTKRKPESERPKKDWASEARNERSQSILRRWRFSKSLALSDSGFLEIMGARRRVKKGGTAAVATDPYREVCTLSLSIFLKSTMLSTSHSN